MTSVKSKFLLKTLVSEDLLKMLDKTVIWKLGWRTLAEVQSMQEWEHIEGVVFDTKSPGQIGDVIGGPYYIKPNVRPTGRTFWEPTGNTMLEHIWEFCFGGSCNIYGGVLG